MRRAGLAGVRSDAAGTVFPPSTKINHAARAVKALAPPKRLYNFPTPALCCQLAPNQRAACGPPPGLRRPARKGLAQLPDPKPGKNMPAVSQCDHFAGSQRRDGMRLRCVAAPARREPRCLGGAQDFRHAAGLVESASRSRIGCASTMARLPRGGIRERRRDKLTIERQHFLCPSKAAQ